MMLEQQKVAPGRKLAQELHHVDEERKNDDKRSIFFFFLIDFFWGRREAAAGAMTVPPLSPSTSVQRRGTVFISGKTARPCIKPRERERKSTKKLSFWLEKLLRPFAVSTAGQGAL